MEKMMNPYAQKSAKKKNTKEAGRPSKAAVKPPLCAKHARARSRTGSTVYQRFGTGAPVHIGEGAASGGDFVKHEKEATGRRKGNWNW